MLCRNTRLPWYPVVSRDTLKEGTKVELVCCRSRVGHSHLHQGFRQSQRSRVKTIKSLPCLKALTNLRVQTKHNPFYERFWVQWLTPMHPCRRHDFFKCIPYYWSTFDSFSISTLFEGLFKLKTLYRSVKLTLKRNHCTNLQTFSFRFKPSHLDSNLQITVYVSADILKAFLIAFNLRWSLKLYMG